MHWFDHFSKAIAADRPTRATMLRSLGGVAFGAAATGALGPGWSSAAESGGQPLGGAAAQRALRGVTALKNGTHAAATAMKLSNPLVRGACTYHYGAGSNDMTFVADGTGAGIPLELTIHHTLMTPASTKGTPSVSGSSAIEVASGGASIVHIDAQFGPATSGTKPDVRLTYRYGSSVHGIATAFFLASRGSVSGQIDGKQLAPFSAGSAVSADTLRLAAGGRGPEIQVDPQLQTGITQLVGTARAKLQTCDGAPEIGPPSRRAIERRFNGSTNAVAHHADRRSGRAHRVLARDVAQYYANEDPNFTYQNLKAPQYAGTPNCTAAINAAGNSLTQCLAGAVFTAIFGTPAAGASIAVGCYETAALELLEAFIPGTGGCCQHPCPSLGCCDSSYTCCGDICCPGGDTCSVTDQGGVCCPPADPVGCNGSCAASGYTCCGYGFCSTGNFCADPTHGLCCPTGSQPCGTTLCCPGGTACADPANALCCPPGYSSTCGGLCCQTGYTCQSGVCTPPGLVPCGNVACAPGSCLNSGTRSAQCCASGICDGECCTPLFGNSRGGARQTQPASERIQTCIPPHVPCRSELSGTTYSTCCEPKQICCGDQCCTNGTTCCADAQGNPRCAQCIK